MSPGARFRALLNDPPLVCLGAHDPVTAKLAEQAGAKAVFVSGYAASAVIAGAPDLGVITQTEMFEHVRRICRATALPVFADCDTGYGGPLEAQRTIRLWEEAGAAALHVEDQVAPKKCGAFAAKEIIPVIDMQQKLRAMLEARRDPDFFVVARTDSFGVTSFDETLERMEAYAATGVDGRTLYRQSVWDGRQPAVPHGRSGTQAWQRRVGIPGAHRSSGKSTRLQNRIG